MTRYDFDCYMIGWKKGASGRKLSRSDRFYNEFYFETGHRAGSGALKFAHELAETTFQLKEKSPSDEIPLDTSSEK